MQPTRGRHFDAIGIAEFLEGQGFSNPDAAARARAVLERDGKTNPRKQGIAIAKIASASTLLQATLARICEACSRLHPDAASGREPVIVKAEDCELCRGSNNRRAARVALNALQQAEVRHVLVVGGWPTALVELRDALTDPAIDLRLVEGRKGLRPISSVERDLSWADVLVVWGNTPLDHALSEPYTSRARAGKFRTPKLTVQGGVEAFCRELHRHAERRRAATAR